MSSANKTKDWLKNQLVTHGVPLPASSAKKEEYQRLYDEQVRPRQSNTEFSSDDDAEDNSAQEEPVRAPSVPSSRPQNGTEGSDKYATWVQRLSDTNLFSALKAHGKEVGGIVDSTRALYQNMLIGLMKTDPQKSISEIQLYLTTNETARKLWNESGVELNGVFNGVSNTNGNGNTENGYSDSDEDETVETASRASRSSRASSKRMTPVRTPPSPKEPSPSPRVLTESNTTRSKRVVTSHEDSLDGINEEDNDVVPSTSRAPLSSDSYYNRVSSPSSSGVFNKPVTMRKTVAETYETTRMYSYEDGRSETFRGTEKPRSSPPKAGAGSKVLTVLKYLLLLVTIVVIPVLAYLILGLQSDSQTCPGGSECSSDELDALLQTLDGDNVAAPGGGV